MIAPRWRNNSALNIAMRIIGAENIHPTIAMNFLLIFFLSFTVQTSNINRVIPKARPRTDVFEYEKKIAVITNRDGIQIDDMRSLILTDAGMIVFCLIFAFTNPTCFKSSDFDSFFKLFSDICIVSSMKPIYIR